MATTLNVILEGRYRDRGIRRGLRAAAGLANDLAVNIDRAATAGRLLGGSFEIGASSRGRRGLGDGFTESSGRGRAVQSGQSRAARDFDRALERALAGTRKEAERQAKLAENLTKEQLVALELQREINRRRRAEARTAATKQLGPDPTQPARGGRSGRSDLALSSHLSMASAEFEQLGRRTESGLRASFDAYKDYQHKVAEIGTITEAVSLKQIDAISKSAVAEFGGKPMRQAEALQKVMSMGAATAADAQAQLMAANKLGIAGSANVADAVTAISKSVANFKGVDAQQAADAIFAVTQASSAEVGDLAQSLPRIAAGAAGAGLSLQETVGTIGQMSNKLGGADEAVTALIGMVGNIQKPMKSARDEADRLGIDFSVAGIKAAGGWEEFLLKLRAAEGFDENSIAKLFESSNARLGIAALTGDMEGLRTNLEAQEKAAGGTEKAYAKMTDTAAHKAALLEGQWELLKIQAGESLVPALTTLATKMGPIITSLTEWTRENPRTAETLGKLAIGAAVFGRAAGIVTSALSMYNAVAGLAAMRTAALTSSVSGGANAATTAATGYGRLGPAVGALPGIFALATAGVVAFNLVLDAAQKPLLTYERKIDEIIAKQQTISFKTEDGKERTDEAVIADQRSRLVDMLNAARTMEHQAGGGTALGQLKEGDVGGAFGSAFGSILNQASGTQDVYRQQVTQAELDLMRFDQQYGEQLGIAEGERFTTSTGFLGDGSAVSELARLLEQQIAATERLAVQSPPWQGPSLEAGTA